jgi:hypothetical protein
MTHVTAAGRLVVLPVDVCVIPFAVVGRQSISG